MKWLMAVLAALLVAACGSTDPFVYKAEEFDRGSAMFNREPADITEVAVCYNTMTADAAAVRMAALERCQAYGKQARLRDEAWLECPLLTPAGALYDCVE